MKFIFSLSCGTVVMDVGLWARNVSDPAPPGSAVFGDGPRSVSRVWVIGHLVSLTGLAVTAVACDHLICVCPCHRTSNRPGAHLSCRKRPLPGLWLSSEARWCVPFWWFGWREPDSGLLSYADNGAPPGWELVVGARSPFRVGAWCLGKTLVVSQWPAC